MDNATSLLLEMRHAAGGNTDDTCQRSGHQYHVVEFFFFNVAAFSDTGNASCAPGDVTAKEARKCTHGPGPSTGELLK
jgi:hypothetical protein